MCLPNFREIHAKAVEIFQSEPKVWTDNPTDTAVLKQCDHLLSLFLSHLVVEEGLGLFDISQKQMENVSLDQNLSPALPHLQQFVPADIELLEPLLQGGLRERSLLGLQQLVHGLQALVVLFIPARKMQLFSEPLMCF